MRKLFCINIQIAILLLSSGPLFAQKTLLKRGEWGDQLDGTYKNPIINADYSDPDVIRVGDNFYMVCSEFHFMGMPVLQSKDLVNWHIIGQVYNRLGISPKYDHMDGYGSGSWAPSIRYHKGLFYVYFCTPDEGLFMSSAADPAGPWSPLTTVKRVSGWEDPCPFWDDDGKAYLGHSQLGAGPIIVHRLSEDGKQLLDSGKKVYEGPVAEGTKFYKRNGYYYLIIPEGGVGAGYETALRSRNIYGPYERKIVLEQGKTKVNGPHQGGLVELDSGQSWFIHFQAVDMLGRVLHLEPMKWLDDWPVIGVDLDGNGIGEPVDIYPKPINRPSNTSWLLQTSDEFNTNKLGLQWQWNHNPANENWTVNHPKSYLALTAMQAPENKRAKNTLTQKLMGRRGEASVKMNITKMQLGQRAGLALIGNNVHEIGIIKTDSGALFYADNNGKFVPGQKVKSRFVYLRILINLDGNSTLSFSTDNKHYQPLGDKCSLSASNFWKAVRPGLFSYNTMGSGGTAFFDWFRYSYDGTGPRDSNYTTSNSQ